MRSQGNEREAKELVREIIGYQMENGSWSKHTFVTSIILCMLRKLDVEIQAAEKAEAYLRRIQKADGGFPPFELPVWDTAFILNVLNTVGCIDSIKEKARAFLLKSGYDGGWGWDVGVEPEYDSTSMVVCALEGKPQTAVDYLLENQRADGSWGTWRKVEAGSPDVTAHCIMALPKKYEEQRKKGAEYLIDHREEGVWFPHWYFNVYYGVSQCALAVHAAYNSSMTLENALEFIEKHQNNDGGWGNIPGDASNAMGTAHATLTLSLLKQEKAAEGIEWLVKNQRDGTWKGVNCGIGPRPIRYSDHAIIHASCVWAMSNFQKEFG